MIRNEPGAPLTPVQSGIAACLLEAMTDKEIARAIGLQPGTVEEHIARMRIKLQARNRVELALKLQRMA